MWITTKLPGADNKITVFINCNIYEDNGALLGTVGVGLQIDSLQALIQEYENQYHVEAYLVDQARRSKSLRTIPAMKRSISFLFSTIRKKSGNRC